MTKERKCIFHKWMFVFKDGMKEVEQCIKCKEYRSTMYDMYDGSTNWVIGNLWL